MGFFRKNKINFEDENGKTPVKFSEKEKTAEDKIKRRKKIKRVAISLVILLVVSFGAFFGIKAYNSIKNIFAGETGILNLLGGSQNKPLKGEADGRTNILLLGVGDEGHSGSTLSDTMIILSIDTRNKAAAMFSIPRDLYVKIPDNGYAKINSAHAYGEMKKPGSGPDLAKRTIEETFDTPIHYFVRTDFSGLAKLVDALGGVNVNVERSFCDYSYPVERKGDTRKVCFTAGDQAMNGTKALQYSRSRHALGPEGSDFARSKRQQNLLMAVKDKALSLNTVFNPKKVLSMLEVLGAHVKTDIQVGEMARLFELSKEIDRSKVISKNFDNSPEGMLVSSSGAAGYVLVPRGGDFDEIQEVIKNIFSSQGIKTEKATISLYNGTTSYGLANKAAEELKSAGYNVAFTGNAESRNYYQTVIIDYSGSKPETLRALESKFGVKAKKETSGTATTDIKVVIGRDYK